MKAIIEFILGIAIILVGILGFCAVLWIAAPFILAAIGFVFSLAAIALAIFLTLGFISFLASFIK